MSDIPVNLIEQYADLGVGEVYLPGRVKVNSANAISEKRAGQATNIEAAKEYFDNPDRLRGDKIPDTTIEHERPIHRMMIYLHASGATADDIAKQTGYSRASVYTILKQPWARSRLVQILNETGRDRVKHFLTQEVSPSLEVLREIRDDPRVPANARISSANSILDRALGKATIHVESETKITNVPAEAARLDAELKSVRQQLEAKGFADVQPN